MCTCRILFIVVVMLLTIDSGVNARQKGIRFSEIINKQTNGCSKEFFSKTCGDYEKAINCYERAIEFATGFEKKISDQAKRQYDDILNKQKQECPENLLPNGACYNQYIKTISDDSSNALSNRDSKDLCRWVNSTLKSLETLKVDCPQNGNIPPKISLFEEYQSIFCSQGTLQKCKGKHFKRCFHDGKERDKYKCGGNQNDNKKVHFGMRKCFIQEEKCDDKKLKFTKRALFKLCRKRSGS